jgi:hypothetical protein
MLAISCGFSFFSRRFKICFIFTCLLTIKFILGVFKYLNSLMRIRDPGWGDSSDPGSGMERSSSRIRNTGFYTCSSVIQVPDSETILVVKTLLQAETGVPPCQQELRGWGAAHPASAAAVSDARRLSELNLPKENFLFLLTPDVPAIVDITADENVVEASTWYW